MELDWDFRLSLINDIVKEQITLESSVTTLNNFVLVLSTLFNTDSFGFFTLFRIWIRISPKLIIL